MNGVPGVLELSPIRPTEMVSRYRSAPLDQAVNLPSGEPLIRVQEKSTGEIHYWKQQILPSDFGSAAWFQRIQSITTSQDGTKRINGRRAGKSKEDGQIVAEPQITWVQSPEYSHGGYLGINPFGFLRLAAKSCLAVQRTLNVVEPDGSKTILYESVPVTGNQFLSPGNSSLFSGLRSGDLMKQLDFVSLMLALFCGTASLPHILIRYYTVKDAAAARKSTVVGLSAISLFYILTLFIGVGAVMTSSLDPTNTNLSAPLLARTFGEGPFALISAIAFTTVLGTVSGLILAAAGAVAHDLASIVGHRELSDAEKVRLAKVTAIVVGIIAMLLGIQFEKLNVSFLVGWAFNIAASANLPAIIMILFWSRTTKAGVVASILVGIVTSLGWILLSAQSFREVYGIDPGLSPMPFSQPGIVTIPLSFATLVIVSLFSKR
jgi:cation/acetate symporter